MLAKYNCMKICRKRKEEERKRKKMREGLRMEEEGGWVRGRKGEVRGGRGEGDRERYVPYGKSHKNLIRFL